MQNHLKHELHNVISGKSEVRFGTIIQAIASYLKNGEEAGFATENGKQFKAEETERLKNYITQNNLWVAAFDLSKYVSEGAEQKVYLKDSEHVLKLPTTLIWELFLRIYMMKMYLPEMAYYIL